MKTCLPLLFLLGLAPAVAAQDLIVRCGETKSLEEPTGFMNIHMFTYDTVVVEAGGTLSFAPFHAGVRLEARRGIRIDGLLDLSGEDGRPLRGTAHLQEPGGFGGPGGLRGGTGNVWPGQSSPKGGDGLGPGDHAWNAVGGKGGDSSYGIGSSTNLQAAGGGGGRLAADQPVASPASSPLNLGLVATPGQDGSPLAISANSASGVRPKGGAAGLSIFVDANPGNDFWGRGLDPTTGLVVLGELAALMGGRGGGAGGDCALSATFPVNPWTVTNYLKGAGGGGGGGLGVIVTPRLQLGPGGSIRADGGDGAHRAPGSVNFNVTAASGAGSGGMIVMQVKTLDLRSAEPACITALGGKGGDIGSFQMHGSGGNGGAGILQLHMTDAPSGILLPPNTTLFDMTRPLAHVLLPESGL